MTTASAESARGLDHPSRDAIRVEAVLQALADPIRLRIVREIADRGELACGVLDLPVTKSTCTHHYRVLRESGVIRQRCVGTSRLNTLRKDDLDALFPGLLDGVLAARRD
ncbi:MAG: helix-turn-helix transcriptional regulator [Kutzneria sp.]|nr:helix-turn-helix transcriptional regulator [Kutzneria sp.]